MADATPGHEPVPEKYRALAALADRFDVPAMVLLDATVLRSIFANFDAVLGEADEVVSRAVRTFGSFLSEDWEKLSAIMETLRPAEGAEAALATALEPHFGPGWRQMQFAVRSAAIAEDLATRSFAGIYHTELGVQGVVGLRRAVALVWRSAFSRSALVERIAAGRLQSGNPICVIVQTQIDPDLAGVAFSADPLTGRPDCIVEAVTGIGESLVSGADAGMRVIFPEAQQDATLDANPLGPVAQLCRAVAVQIGHPVDIEWAIAGGRVWLLQVRPITTLQPADESNAEPVLEWQPLYADDQSRLAAFEPIPEFARYFRAKRKRIHDFGVRQGLGQPAAAIVRANARGLADGAAAERFAGQFGGQQVIIDLNDRIRQLIVPTAGLRAELTSLMQDPNRVHTFVVRDFVRGDIGLITEPSGSAAPGDIVAEWTADGLLAINRGTAVTAVATIGKEGVTGTAPPLSAGRLDELRRATLAAQASLGPVRLEWVADSRHLYAIDFSGINGASHVPANGDIIAHGYTEGPVVALDADHMLVALSVAPSMSLTDIPDADSLGDVVSGIVDRLRACKTPPIVVIDRPYAILAALLPYAAGFVFERASSLCHLSILLRERGLPAMQTMTDFNMARGAGALRIDTRAQGITVLEHV